MARAWMLLIYGVPTKPSRTRWHVWREIRRAGAILLRDGVAVLPSEHAAAWMHDVARDIATGGGNAQVVTAQFSAADERAILRSFAADRAREYGEIADSCAGLLEHVDREAAHAQFTFAELAALEADIDKLRRWLEAARGRDHFKSSRVKRAEGALAQCERKIARFAEQAERAEQRPPSRRPGSAPRQRSGSA
ncbi:MAG: hypothetical protein M3T56_14410 [Chloroflexota bacterium]|nr:hypothetical protein [Chloroflexota bacterium]